MYCRAASANRWERPGQATAGLLPASSPAAFADQTAEQVALIVQYIVRFLVHQVLVTCLP